MDVTQLVLTWFGWPNDEKLALTLMPTKVSASQAQVNASARKAWPNGVASRPKFSTCVYLRCRLARALQVEFGGVTPPPHSISQYFPATIDRVLYSFQLFLEKYFLHSLQLFSRHDVRRPSVCVVFRYDVSRPVSRHILDVIVTRPSQFQL